MEIILPVKGKSLGVPMDKQLAATTAYINNVRPRDVLENRVRIGQRPGLDKWGAGTQIGGIEQPVVAMCSVSSII